MDHHPQTPAPDLETAHLEAQELPQPWQQALASADRQAEVQALDSKVPQRVLEDLALVAVAHRLASLQDSLLLASLHLALVDLPVDLLALHLPLAAAASLPGD